MWKELTKMKNDELSLDLTNFLNITDDQVDIPKEDIFSLANAFLSIDSMTNKKLQKLCYYAKAWYLALYDENLITENFEAWVHGAVQPDLYQVYSGYGYIDIPQVFNLNSIPEEFLYFANLIYESYGHLTGDQLEVLNHSEDPWINARCGLKPWEKCNNVISEDDMRNYYRKLLNDAK